MKRIESKDLGLLEYERFEFFSKRLARTETLGLIRPKGTRPQSTLYYFHAGNTNDRMMIEMELIDRLDTETQQFLVSKGVQFALPNLGVSFLTSAEHDPKRPYLEYFWEDVMPLAEEGTDTTAGTRFLSGASLGGHSALVPFFKRPDQFKGVATTMGALMNFNFHSEEDFARYVREAGVSPDYAENLKKILFGYFDSYDLYRTIDPMLMLEQLDAIQLRDKKILVETGSADDFGLHAGMTDLTEALTRKGVQHRFDLVKGGRHEPAFVMSRFAPMLRFLLT